MFIRQKLTLQKILFTNKMTAWALLIGFLINQTVSPKVFASKTDFIKLESSLYLCWKYQTAGGYKIASDNAQEIYLYDFQSVLTAINSNGRLKDWEAQIGGQIVGKPIVYKQNLIQLISIDKELLNTTIEENEDNVNSAGAKVGSYIIRSTDKMTGVTNWQIKFPQTDLPGEIFSHIFEDNFVVITSTGNLISVDMRDGRIKQKKNINLTLTIPPLFDVSKFYVVSRNNQLSVFSYSDFSEILAAKTIPTVPTALVISQNLLIWGDQRGFVNASSLSDSGQKLKWKSRKGGEILSLFKTAAGILVSSSDNYLYLLSEKSGNTIWKKRLASRPAFNPTVSGNYVIVSTLGDSETLIFDLMTGKLINRITLADGNLFIAAPEILERAVVFQTLDGLFAYSNTPCSNDK